MAIRRKALPGARKPGRPRDTSGARDVKAPARSGFRELKPGRTRDLIQQLDADQRYRSWRLGMRLAFARAGSLLSNARLVNLLALRPWSADDALQLRPATQFLFPSKTSPDGAWTVTVEPRDGPLTTEPLSLMNQREILLQPGPNSDPIRLLEVTVRTDASNNGTWSVRGLLGELVEDSLLLDVDVAPEILPRSEYRFRPDNDIAMMLVVGCNPEAGLIYLDGRRRWRRRPRNARGGSRLVEEIIPGDQSIFLGQGPEEAWLCTSSSYACNCPAFLGIQLQDWRSGRGPGGTGSLPVSGPFSPIRRDPLNEIGRVYRLLSWERDPADSCKHIHCARWLLGCPTEDPGDVAPPSDPYWQWGQEMQEQEEFVSPLRPNEGFETAASMDRWRGLSGLLPAVSGADALALTAHELPLYRSETEGLLLLPLEGVDSDPYLAPVVPGDTVTVDRFNRLWPTEDRFETDGTVGDVWVGKGTATEAYPYAADGQPADTPFITPAPFGETVAEA